MAWAMDQTVCNRNRSRHEPEVQHRLVQLQGESYPSPGVHSFIHSFTSREVLGTSCLPGARRLFTPRQVMSFGFRLA